jgi:AcrR family transcriptional regulator
MFGRCETDVKKRVSSRNYHHGDLKVALIEAAGVLLKEKGIEALSLRTLASEVGVSHMAPYAHFKNKTELFQAIAANGFRSLANRMEDVDTDQKASVLILDYGTQYIEFAIANAPLYRMMLSQTQVTGPQNSPGASNHMSQELKDASKRPFTLLVDAFSEFAPDKGTQSVQAQGAWAMVHGIASLLIDGHLHIPDDMSIKQFLAVASMQMPQ